MDWRGVGWRGDGAWLETLGCGGSSCSSSAAGFDLLSGDEVLGMKEVSLRALAQALA